MVGGSIGPQWWVGAQGLSGGWVHRASVGDGCTGPQWGMVALSSMSAAECVRPPFQTNWVGLGWVALDYYNHRVC